MTLGSDDEAEAFARTVRESLSVLRAHDAASQSVPPPVLASAYVGVAAWGKSYQVLRPFAADPALPTSVREIVAELAFCAGDEATALRLMEVLPSDQVMRAVHGWKLRMQWIDAPRDANELPLPSKLSKRLELASQE